MRRPTERPLTGAPLATKLSDSSVCEITTDNPLAGQTMTETATSITANASAWPLIFSYKGTIMGKGFLAEIALTGRLLASQEMAGVWLYGVNPGALSVGAPTLADA